MRIRRREVRRQNDFYEKVLADAVPQSMEERRHFISSQHYSSLAEAQQQDAIDYADAAISDVVPQSEDRIREQPMPLLIGPTNTSQPSAIASSALAPTKRNLSHKSTQQLLPATKTSVLTSTCSVVANGQSSTAHRRTTKATGCWRSLNTNNLASHSNHTENGVAGRKREHAKRPSSFSYGNEPLGEEMGWRRITFKLLTYLVIKLWRFIIVRVPKLVFIALSTMLSAIAGRLINDSAATVQPAESNSGASPYAQQDDSISVSGDGSHIADDESDQEEYSNYAMAHHPAQSQQSVNRKKGKKIAKQYMTKCNSSTNLVGSNSEISFNGLNGHANGAGMSLELCPD